ncbi:hypothetical protein [Hyphomicrobium sp.]|uniref:hypothetical protein n=1 Tax=Hyphomicrobium sp. TaxID=82 RepID=UPI003F7017A2
MAQLTIRENAKMGRDADEVEPKGRAISREVAKLKKRVERLEKRSKVLEARIQARENAATLPWE